MRQKCNLNKLKYTLYSLQKDKEAQLSPVKLSEVERIHLIATLLKEKKNLETTIINKTTTKTSNHHHKQNKITTTNTQPLPLTDFYRPRL